MSTKATYRRDTSDNDNWRYYLTENGVEREVTSMEWHERLGEANQADAERDWRRQGLRGPCCYFG